MKNTRGLIDHESLIKKHNLDTAVPPPGSLFSKMFDACRDVAEATLATGFLQGIRRGDLDPTIYGGFSISDIFYCYRGAADYGIASKRTTDPILQDYLRKKQESYDHYNSALCRSWKLSGPQSIVPTPTAIKYSDFEISVASGKAEEGAVCDPIFALIVMLPCEYLWAWLAAQMAPPDPANIYASWITANNNPGGAYAMGNFLQNYASRHSVDEKLAIKIYRTAIEYEYRNFHSATPSTETRG